MNSDARMVEVGAETSLEQTCEDLRTGREDPVVITRRALDRVNDNAGRNTYLWLDRERAMQRAASLDSLFPDPSARPALYGLPVSLKDCFDLAGTVTTCGTRFYAQHNPVAGADSAVAQRLLARGAVIIGKTHLHPLAYGITGENWDYGDCTQPGRPQRLTGGSSSGAVASVLEGSAFAAIGTDTGGSIRVPAVLCGLAGYRCSYEVSGDVWAGGAHLAPSFDTIGWLYRSLEDGPWLARTLFDLPNGDAVWQHPTVAVVGPEFLFDCEQAVLEGYESAKSDMRRLGASLVEADVSFWRESLDIFAPIQACEAAELHAGHFDAFESAIRDRLAWGSGIGEAELSTLRKRRAAFCARMDVLFETCELLVLPAAPVTELRAGADHSQTRQRLLRYTTPISLAGFPAVTIPAAAGIDAGGVQVVAKQGSDAALLEWSARIGRARRLEAEKH
jgi:Asp-tRNA(Asn)/Glu-tRNA(Gln) amidotransferase A subunit family amidase